ncbi:unnamed protein product [Brugia pahangi]|uniref:Secreted protein n=1 Tax=Brugia pahangi TaxID=6280 RepID=A0A0N4TVT5_BRUPA|nr:unnamed protein product [Brugia pahangi]
MQSHFILLLKSRIFFHIIISLETKTEFSEHRKVVHSTKTDGEPAMAELCPLCPCKCIELRTHLAEKNERVS